MLTNDKKKLIQQSLKMLAVSHAAVVTQIEEMMTVLIQTLELDDTSEPIPGPSNRPIADNSTFSVSWKGQTCFLGNTLVYWMFERLARSPNHYVAHVDLLDDVWHGERGASTIRGVVKRLRDQLAAAEMQDLAAAIDGSASGYYGLILV